MDAAVLLVTTLFFLSGDSPFQTSDTPQTAIVASLPFAEVDVTSPSPVAATVEEAPAEVPQPLSREEVVSNDAIVVEEQLPLVNDDSIPSLPTDLGARPLTDLPVADLPLVGNDLESLDLIDPEFAEEGSQQPLENTLRDEAGLEFFESQLPDTDEESLVIESAPVNVMPVDMPLETPAEVIEEASAPSIPDAVPTTVPQVEDMATEFPNIEQPVVEQPTVEQPLAEDQPVADQSVTKEPVVEQPVIQQPIADPVAEPAVDVSPVQEIPAIVSLEESPAVDAVPEPTLPVENSPVIESGITPDLGVAAPIPSEEVIVPAPITNDSLPIVESPVEVQPGLQIEQPAKLESQQPALPQAEVVEPISQPTLVEPAAQLPVVEQPNVETIVEQPAVEQPLANEPSDVTPVAPAIPVEVAPVVESIPAPVPAAETLSPISVETSPAAPSIAEPAVELPVSVEPVVQPNEPVVEQSIPIVPVIETAPQNDGTIVIPEHRRQEPEMHCPYSGACTRYSSYR